MRLENGFGSIHNIDGKGVKGKRRKPFRARVSLPLDEEGKRKYRNVGYFKTEREAYEALLEYHRNPQVNKKITVLGIYEKLLKTTMSNLGEKRLTALNGYFYNGCKPIHNMDIGEVKVTHIEQLLYEKSKNIQKEYLGILNKIFDWAIKNEYVTKNYSTYLKPGDVKMAKTKKQNSDKLSTEEVKLILKLAEQNEQYADAVKVYLYTGLRATELFKIKTQNVFLEKGYIIGGFKTDKGTDRIIPIHKEIRPIIEKWMKGNNSMFLVNIPLYNRENVYGFIKKHFPHHKLHNTRHTFTSRMVKLGISDLMIKTIVGHEGGDTTSIYTHVDVEDLIKVINQFYYE